MSGSNNTNVYKLSQLVLNSESFVAADLSR